MIKRTALAVAVALSLTACNGGGTGGPGANPLIRADVPFYQPVNINAYRPNVQERYHVAEIGIFARDLNRDGADEVLTSALTMDGSATQATWNHSVMQIYGWNTGGFANETATWFQGISNTYVGGTTIRFGDFDNDGNIDAFAAAFTDNPNVTGPSVILMNTGQNRFARVDLDLGLVGAHDSLVHDFNGDGYADIWLSDINQLRPVLVLGGPNGQFTSYRSDSFGGAAGLSVADFLGNGSRTVVMTDAPGHTQNGINYDTKLYSWQIQDGKLVLNEVAQLPADRFYLPKWDSVRASTPLSPHAVRNLAFDFNSDGRTDVVVFSTMPKAGNVHGYAEVQFLRNDGGGVFVDVTDSVLRGFDHNKTQSYNPKLIDVNNDGLLDIMLSATDYTAQPSTSVLLATREGVFVESFASVFTDFANQIRSQTIGSPGSVGEIAIILGPDNRRYLFSGVETEINGRSYIKTWLSLIGTTGTVTPQATVSALQQAWPWMSPNDVNASLEMSVSQWIDGMPVLDPWAALSPIGGLGISLEGRNGTRRAITGVLAIPGVDRQDFANVTAIDGLGRNFSVDLSVAALSINPAANIQFSDAALPDQTWSTRFITESSRMDQGFDAQGDRDRWTTGARFGIGSPMDGRSVSVSMSRMPGSPWMAITGMWGQIQSSTMIDAQISQKWSQNFWTQAGVIQTVTDITPGLVQSVSPLWAGYATAGWRQDGWTVYGGVQPTVFHGTLALRLPGHVDNQGTLHYNDITAKIRNPVVGFLGTEKKWENKNTMFKMSAQFNDLGQYRAGVHLGAKW